jgi:hypothetical protein
MLKQTLATVGKVLVSEKTANFVGLIAAGSAIVTTMIQFNRQGDNLQAERKMHETMLDEIKRMHKEFTKKD